MRLAELRSFESLQEELLIRKFVRERLKDKKKA